MMKHHNIQLSFLVDDDYIINKMALNNMKDIPFTKCSCYVFFTCVLSMQETCSSLISIRLLSVRRAECLAHASPFQIFHSNTPLLLG